MYLQLKIEGMGIVIQTREGFLPARPITLAAGENLSLRGPDLAEYFWAGSLEAQGVDPALLTQGGLLPEGFYRFSFQAIEIDRSRAVSPLSTAIVRVFRRQPPILVYPQPGATVTPISPQHLLLSWLPRDMGSLNAAAGGLTTYTLRLYEVLEGEEGDPSVDAPNVVAASQVPVLERTVGGTGGNSLLVGPGDIPLVAGRRYAWQVTAGSLDGQDVYLNGGRSQVSHLVYGGCPLPGTVSVRPLGGGRVGLSWRGSSGVVGYRLRWGLAGEPVQEQTVYASGTELTGLGAGTYRYQVASVCGAGEVGRYGPEATFTVVPTAPAAPTAPASVTVDPATLALSRLLDPDSRLINTGNVPSEAMLTAVLASLDTLTKPKCAGTVASDPTCTSAIITYTGVAKTNLLVGQVLYVNTYGVVLTKLTGNGAGTYSGQGILKLPYLNGALFAVDFQGISVVGGPDTPGGCLTKGEVIVAGSNAGALDAEVANRLVALYASAQKEAQADRFVGKLSEALAALKAKATELQGRLGGSKPPSKADYKALKKNLEAVQLYLKAFESDLTSIFPAGSPELADLQAAVAAQKALLAACTACFEQ